MFKLIHPEYAKKMQTHNDDDDYFQTVETVSESNAILNPSPDDEDYKIDSKQTGKVSFNDRAKASETRESTNNRNLVIPKIVNPTERDSESKKLKPEAAEEPKNSIDIHAKNCANKEENRNISDQSSLKMVLALPTASCSLHFRPGDKTSYLLGTVGGHILLVGIALQSNHFLPNYRI